ncbi:hotdog fold thioesterase [Halalkalibaculum sp. DA384]|uniref:hotdog fold thioesterase n=1 Tax=Halalkalibaculum sp. DA384 TaxID=3373606 RepID=UPI00375465DE
MFIDDGIKKRVDQFLNLSEPNMGDALGIEFTSFKPDEVKATMPVDENTVQPFGILHGGASVALAETLASIGAWLNVKDDSKTAVGIEINANHLRSVKKGSRVMGTATPVHIGRSVQVWETAIETEEGKLVCISRCTLAIVDRGER